MAKPVEKSKDKDSEPVEEPQTDKNDSPVDEPVDKGKDSEPVEEPPKETNDAPVDEPEEKKEDEKTEPVDMPAEEPPKEKEDAPVDEADERRLRSVFYGHNTSSFKRNEWTPDNHALVPAPSYSRSTAPTAKSFAGLSECLSTLVYCQNQSPVCIKMENSTEHRGLFLEGWFHPIGPSIAECDLVVQTQSCDRPVASLRLGEVHVELNHFSFRTVGDWKIIETRLYSAKELFLDDRHQGLKWSELFEIGRHRGYTGMSEISLAASQGHGERYYAATATVCLEGS